MKRFFLSLFAVLMLALSAAAASADTGITTENQKVTFDYPSNMTFTLNATSDSEIQSATLVVRFPDVTRRINAKFTPAKDVDLQVKWQLDTEDSSAEGGFVPPGVSAEYNWILKDAAGSTIETEPQNLTVEDNRIDWQTVEDDQLAIHWYGAGKAFGQDIFDEGSKTLQQLREELGAGTGGKAHIWYYTDHEDFRTSMPDMNAWTGGRSFGNYRVILLTAEPTDPREAIEGGRHELTHQVIYDSLGGGIARQAFPHWFNEGLATYNQFDNHILAGYLSNPLRTAITTDSLPRLKSRDGNFPPDSTEALVSYGLSYAIVKMMFDDFGSEKVQEVYRLFQKGTPADEAFKQVFGLDTDGLDNMYRKSVGLQERDYSNMGIPTPRSVPTFSLSGAETPVPSGEPTATRQSIAAANTPPPAPPTAAPQSGSTNNSGGASTGLCGIGGGIALAMFGAYEWRRRRKPTRL